MQLTSVLLLALSTVAFVRADTYSTCLFEFSNLVGQTNFDSAHTISTTGIGPGECQGCPWKCIATAFHFATAAIPRPIVARGAFNQLMRKCLGTE